MSFNPAKILGLEEKGSVSEGKIADIVIFDPDKSYAIDKKYLCVQRKEYAGLTAIQ